MRGAAGLIAVLVVVGAASPCRSQQQVDGYPLPGAADVAFFRACESCPVSILTSGGTAGVGLHVLSGGGVIGLYLSMSASLGLSASLGRCVFGDVDGDGVEEVLVVSGENNLMHLNELNGFGVSSSWPQSLGVFCTAEIESYALADLDSDGSLDIVSPGHDVCASFLDQNSIHAVDHLGVSLPGFPVSLPLQHFPTCVATADLDLDGQPEIVVSTGWIAAGVFLPRPLYAFRADGSLVPGFPVNVPGDGWLSSIAIGDVNNDGEPEIVGSSFSDVVVVDRSGMVLHVWSRPPLDSDPLSESIALADIDSDGSLEVISASGRVRVWTGQLQLVAERTIAGVSRSRALVIGDSDGDGSSELAFFGESPTAIHIVVLNSDLTDVAGFPIAYPGLSVEERARPYLTDLDGDLDLELCYGFDDGIFAWELPGEGTGTSQWQGVPGQITGSKTALEISWTPRFVRGDADGDGVLGLLDVLTLLAVYQGLETAPCVAALDVDDSAAVNLLDAVTLLTAVFGQGSASIPHPSPDCGVVESGPLDCSASTCP